MVGLSTRAAHDLGTRQHKTEMYAQKVMTTVHKHKHSDATSRSADLLCRELSLCIRPSLTWPPAGGPGSSELALDGDLDPPR